MLTWLQISKGELMINKDSRTYLYLQIKENLLAKINKGIFPEGKKIPSEEKLCEMYNVSRPTIRFSIKQLLLEGRLNIVKGKGTFVLKKRPMSFNIEKVDSFADEIKKKGLTFRDEILEFKITKPTSEVANILKITNDSNVILYNKVRIVENEPMYITKGFIPKVLCPNLIEEDIKNQSIFHLLNDKYKLNISMVGRSLEAIIAGTEELKSLKIDSTMPLHYLETILYDSNSRPINYVKTYFRGDRSRFTFEINVQK